MFDLDRWQEIFSSIRSNVLRTVLSGFTVALGLFIFIVLFGIGKGFRMLSRKDLQEMPKPDYHLYRENNFAYKGCSLTEMLP
jgi:putative ABC transport system permease protein